MEELWEWSTLGIIVFKLIVSNNLTLVDWFRALEIDLVFYPFFHYHTYSIQACIYGFATSGDNLGNEIVEGKKWKFKDPDCYDINTFGLRVHLIFIQGCFFPSSTSVKILPNNL